MGKTPKPLQILIPSEWEGQEQFVALAKQGHTVVHYCDVESYVIDDFDLILGPHCWRMTPDLMKHLDLAIAGARALRYPRKEK